jgi:uncharacterized membrane protein YeiH
MISAFLQEFYSILTAALHWPGRLVADEVVRSPWVVGGDLLATAVCAVTGVLMARRKQLDIIGVSVIAVVSGLGGGTLRDLLLGAGPVFWVAEPQGVAAALLAGWATFALCHRFPFQKSAFIVPDAFGLALFTILGTEKALVHGHGWLVAAMMGVITGTFGGVGRDVLCNEVPSIFTRRELYATAALAGALVFIGCRVCGLPGWNCALLGLSTIAGLRLAAVRWKLHAPGFRDPAAPNSGG